MTFIGFYQEAKAEKEMEALKKLAAPKSKVRRNGVVEWIISDQIVPGDVLILESGDHIAADARLMEVSNLRMNESSLTGESAPIKKHTAPIKENASLADSYHLCSLYPHPFQNGKVECSRLVDSSASWFDRLFSRGYTEETFSHSIQQRKMEIGFVRNLS